MHRIAITIALVLGLAACDPPADPGHDRFTIETAHQQIRVEGSESAFQQHGAQILARIDAVDPALIRPGIGLWAEPEDTAPHLPGRPKLVLVGRVVAVEPRAGGY